MAVSSNQPADGPDASMAGRFALRLLGAFGGACVVVFFLSLIAASLVSRFGDDEEDELVAHPLSRLVGYSSLDLAELLGEPRRQVPELPPPPPAIELPKREVRGFVQLQVTVDAAGEVIDAAVVSAAPEGVYEAQALEAARAMTYPSGRPGVKSEIIDFTVPAGAAGASDAN